MSQPEKRIIFTEYMPIYEPEPDPENPRDHDEEGIDDSFDEFGYVTPPTMNEETGYLLEGHGRQKVLIARYEAGGGSRDGGASSSPLPLGLDIRSDGMWLWPVNRGVHLDPVTGKVYVIRANRQVELSKWDDPQLYKNLRDLEAAGRLKGTGFTDKEYDALADAFCEAPEEGDISDTIDRAEELREKWGVETGQLWGLGAYYRCKKCGKIHDA